MLCERCGATNQANALFCSQCGGKLAPHADTSGATALHGERRQITALFCDIVESTKLASRLDPEDYHEVIAAFSKCCTDAVAGFDGQVREIRGDGALAIFGYPAARGDESERAIRAALELIDSIGRLALPDKQRLQVRIGIATGLAAIEPGNSQTPVFASDALNLAARLQSLAEPDSAVISSLAKRLAGGFFDLVDLGVHELKGFAKPVPVWQVRGIKSVASRFEALRPELTEFVGRQNELQQIAALWQQAKLGKGQVVEISGEAGIGKSRLINQAQDTLCEKNQIAKYSCSPYHTGTALYPVIEQMARMLRFRPEQSPDERLAQLKDFVARAGGDYEPHLKWIAALMSLPSDAPTTVSAQEARQRTIDALLWWLMAASKKLPLLIIVEDAHWIDPTSLQLMQLLVDQVGSMAALILVSYRAPYGSPWVDHPARHAIALDRLDRANANAIVTSVAGEGNLPPALIEQIVDKTDGIPLFVEEMTKMVLDTDAAQERSVDAPLSLPPAQLPTTLLDSLNARLDQLAPAKRVAQIAAVLGREFSYDILSEISGLAAAALVPLLGQLVEAGLIHQTGSATQERRFAFKHALVRDAAYQSLLKRDRRDLHASVAGLLDRKNADKARFPPELIAQHYSEAGAILDALKYWGIAARRALQMSANAEAVVHATRGLELLEAMPDTPERRRLELELRIALGWGYWSLKGFPSQEVERTFKRTRELATEIGDDEMLNLSLRGMFACLYTRGDLRGAFQLGEQELALSSKLKNNEGLIWAHWALGCASYWMGEFERARREFEASCALYDPKQQKAEVFSSQVEPQVNCNAHLAWPLWILGFPDQALQQARFAVGEGRRGGLALSLSMALFLGAVVEMNCGELEEAAEYTRDLLAVTARHNVTYLHTTGMLLDGALTAAKGDPKSGLFRLRQAVSEYRAIRGGLGIPWSLSLIAEASSRSGAAAEAQATVGMGLAAINKEGERHWEAELYRIGGEAILASPDGDAGKAEAAFRQAIAVAQRQKALSLELRATMSHARLLLTRGERASARDSVAVVYSRFTEGFGTADLVAAKALLDELAGAAA